jgi:hypothetical protein
MGFVWPEEGANPWIEAAHAALSTIEELDPAIVIPGHGEPFADAGGAIRTVRAKLDAFARDPAKNARHALKVLFVFALLDRQAMRVDAVADYVARVPSYGRLSGRFLHLEPAALARWLLADLERAGAIRIAGGEVRPLVAA